MKALMSEKAPYVVTVFVATLGFLISQTVDRYNKAPTVEFSIEKTGLLADVVALSGAASAAGPKIFLDVLPSLGQSGYVLSLENISSTHVITCARFDFLLLPRPGGPSPSISNWVTSTSATSPVKRLGAEKKERLGVTVVDMQPGGWIELRINASNVGDVSILPRPCGASELGPGAAKSDLPIVQPRSFGTMLSKYGMQVFWLALAAWAALLAFLLAKRLVGGREA